MRIATATNPDWSPNTMRWRWENGLSASMSPPGHTRSGRSCCRGRPRRCRGWPGRRRGARGTRRRRAAGTRSGA
ncbi:MAG: hypothetical protein MZV63_14170 [Marinilabiliales bacterium]|nr:hypothetical protein [Marinilabiliales bacterium]